MPNNVRIGAIAGGAVGGVALATVIGYLVYHALLAYSFDAIWPGLNFFLFLISCKPRVHINGWDDNSSHMQTQRGLVAESRMTQPSSLTTSPGPGATPNTSPSIEQYNRLSAVPYSSSWIAEPAGQYRGFAEPHP